MLKLCKIIRVVTAPPIMALIAEILLYIYGDVFADATHFAVAVITLCALPLLAYPLSLLKEKNKRRAFQRGLAIVLSVCGYLAGTGYAFFAKGADGEKAVYLTYLLSGIAIALSSFVLKKKSSGHACGIAGPLALLAYFVNPAFIAGAVLLVPVGYASVKMKRHTCGQLIAGTVIPVICFAVAVILI